MAEEKIAVVTGSSSGIGLLTTVELALNGYRVVATMRNLANSSQTRRGGAEGRRP